MRRTYYRKSKRPVRSGRKKITRRRSRKRSRMLQIGGMVQYRCKECGQECVPPTASYPGIESTTCFCSKCHQMRNKLEYNTIKPCTACNKFRILTPLGQKESPSESDPFKCSMNYSTGSPTANACDYYEDQLLRPPLTARYLAR